MSNGTQFVFNTSGSIKEIGTGATNHLSSRGLCSQSSSCRLRQGGVPEGAVH